MMASIVVDHLIKTFRHGDASLGHKTGVACLYCSYGRRNEESLDNLLASLLAQLVLDQVTIPQTIRELHDNSRRTRPSSDKISKKLCSIINTYSRVFIVIDALDECRDDSIRRALLSEIFKMQGLYDTRLMATFWPRIKPEVPSTIETLEIRA
jgi:hypothetical protein